MPRNVFKDLGPDVIGSSHKASNPMDRNYCTLSSTTTNLMLLGVDLISKALQIKFGGGHWVPNGDIDSNLAEFIDMQS